MSKCVVEWRGLGLSCLHCGEQWWRAALLWFLLETVCLDEEPLSVDAITPLFFPTFVCMYTFYEIKMEISSLRRKAINMIICVFSIHLQVEQKCTVFMFPARVIHFNVSTENISHCFSILTDIGQHRHPFIIWSCIEFQCPVCSRQYL